MTKRKPKNIEPSIYDNEGSSWALIVGAVLAVVVVLVALGLS